MFTVTTYEYNPPEDVTCVDEGNDGRSNSIGLERGLVSQDSWRYNNTTLGTISLWGTSSVRTLETLED